MDLTNAIVKPILTLSTWGVGCALTLKIAQWLEANGKPRARETAISLMAPYRVRRHIANVAAHFRDMLDIVFTENHWSWACLFRSSLVSVVFIIAGYGLLLATRTEEVFSYFGTIFNAINAIALTNAIIAAVLTDFFALWLTRMFVRTLAAREGSWRAASMFLLLTAAHIMLVFTLVTLRYWIQNRAFVFASSSGAEPRTLEYFAAAVTDLLLLRDLKVGWIMELPTVWATFLTVLWLLLYAGAWLLLQFARCTAGFLKTTHEWVDLEKQPFHTIAFAVNVVWTVVYFAILYPVVWRLAPSAE